MSQPVRRHYTSLDSGPQSPVNLDFTRIAQTTFAVAVLSGTATFAVEVTLDDVNDPDVTPYWFPLDEIPAGTTESIYAAVHNPWLFARLNLELITGEVRFEVQQALGTRH